MNHTSALADGASGHPSPHPRRSGHSHPLPHWAASDPPSKKPPASGVASGLFDDRKRPRTVEILLRTGPTRRKVDWAMGFASQRAATAGPTALISMEPGTLRIQLHSAGQAIPIPPNFIRKQVEWSLSWAAWVAKTTVVVPVEHDRLGAYMDWDVPIHLMTETVDTSVVGTYQWLKRIHTCCVKHKVSPPAVDLVLIDAPHELARRCARKLERTTNQFLGRTLPTECIINRMPRTGRILELNFNLEPGYGCDQVLETLDCRQHDRPHGRLGSPFS